MGTVMPLPIAILFSLFFLSSQVAPAAEVKKELEGIRKKIEKEKRGLVKIEKKEGSVLQSLEKIEAELDRKNRELRKVNAKLESILADIQRKEQEVGKLTASLEVRKRLLKKRAVALYKWHRGGSPFVLLNGGSSLAELMQRKRYLGLTLAQDQELVGYLLGESRRKEALKRELVVKRGELDGERRALVEIKESVRSEREKKREILSGLRQEKQAHAEALKELEGAAHKLQQMMDELSRRAPVKSARPPSGTGFEAMKGNLAYPVRGEVIGGFGKTRHPDFSAELFRKGIDIQAPFGEEVRAVDGGRVIFADRFSGYGKMVIIDHGQRYYTIYAHLSDLLKQSGEAVQRGEPVALVGDSDSLKGARLYFEIRKDGRPLNPRPWFKER